jgi:hypothetical protein
VKCQRNHFSEAEQWDAPVRQGWPEQVFMAAVGEAETP